MSCDAFWLSSEVVFTLQAASMSGNPEAELLEETSLERFLTPER